MEVEDAKFLKGVKTALVEHGHCHDVFTTTRGEICLASAAVIAGTGIEPRSVWDWAVNDHDDQIVRLGGLLGVGHTVGAVCDFNNHHTIEEILAALDRASAAV